MARSRNTADTQTASGGPVSPFIAGKNAVINGGMDVWQRGTSITGTSGVPYTADRWQVTRVGTTGYTTTRQSSGATLPEIQYCLRAQRDSGNTSTQFIGAFYTLESVNSIPFAGKTATMSYYIRAGANYSGGAVTVEFSQGTGTDQNIIQGGFTSKTNVGSSSITLTTSWQRLTITGTVATNTTQLGLQFYWTPSGTAGAADFVEITGVQVEVGQSATPFSRAGGTIQGELAACQRYYVRWANNGGQATALVFGGTSSAYVYAPGVNQMRTTPSMATTYTNASYNTAIGAGQWALGVDGTGYATKTGTITVNLRNAGVTFTGATYSATPPNFLLGADSTLYIEASAEL